ncbi:hypothetical protein CS0771_26690 [Catellatospora sp. IY07-71]|uniref:hypothetical protein n=1 Tax=Catellatospora sp. IY07-71 TaxID=2728827 RepID=UPI001BB37432|nr:hypothetical protein [Catellatospora sp. IY07-71]BCJ73125.1 hypothetical protein CS0771_26690 [Catellatospora sp. IY07-71]
MDHGESRDALRGALGWLAHPISIAGLLLLLLNDHVLKAWQPGWVTGKLSDAAGMLMFPPLLAVLGAVVAPRLPGRVLAAGALTATAAGFAYVKATAYGALLASQAWSVVNGPSLVRADRTDLLALPFLGLCWWAWRRAGRGPGAGRGIARLVRGAVLVPVALLATAATTAAPTPPETVAVVEDGRHVYLGIDDDGTLRWLISNDDGLTWDGYGHGPTVTVAPPAPESDCAGDVCYRVVHGELHVQTRQDGGPDWRTAWEVRGPQLAELIDAYDGGGLLSSPVGELRSFGLVVRESGGGHVVLVANGRDGLLRRAADGTWTRLGTWDEDRWEAPPPLAELWVPDTGARLRADARTVVVMFLFVLLAAAIAAAAGRLAGSPAAAAGQRVVTPWAQVLAGLAGCAALISGTLAVTSAGPGLARGVAVSLLVSGMAALCALVLLMVRVRRAGLVTGRRAGIVLAIAAAGAAVAALSRAALFAEGLLLDSSASVRGLAAAIMIVTALAAAGAAVAAVRLRAAGGAAPPEPTAQAGLADLIGGGGGPSPR